MKITYIVNDISFHGGLEKVVLNIAEYLVKNGNDVTILSLNIKQDLFYDANFKIKIENLNFKVELSDRKILKYINETKYINDLKKQLEEYFKNEKDEEIVVGTFYQSNIALAKLSNKKIKKIAWEHSHYYGYVDPIKNYSGMKGKLKEVYHKLIIYKNRKKYYSKLDKVVVLTKKDLEIWKKDLKNVMFIHNPLTLSSKEKSLLLNKKIISVGRLCEQKGFNYLINAFEQIYKKNSDWELEIIGSGEKKEELFSMIKEKKLEKVISLIEATPNIREKYIEGSIYAFSSIFEGFGLVILEAMESGLPIVAFDCYAGPSDLIINGENGLLCETRNANEMAEKINYLIENKNIKEKIVENALKSVKEYKIELIGEKWMQLFQKIKKK